MPLLHFQEFGQGEALVLLHGLFGQSDNLVTVAKHFATKYRVIVPDLVNHGKSFHSTEMDYPAMAENVKALLNELSIDNCLLVGHSMGGKVAMQFSATFPDMVSKLVVVDIAPVEYPDLHSSVFDALNAVVAANCSKRSDAADVVEEFIQEHAVKQFLLKNFKRDVSGKWSWQFSLPYIQQSYFNLRKAPSIEKPFTGDVLFIKGGDSDYIVSNYQDVSKKLFPRLQIKIIQGAGHWLHAEKPKAFIRLLERFFDQ